MRRSEKQFNVARIKTYNSASATQRAIDAIKPGEIVQYHQQRAGAGYAPILSDDWTRCFAAAYNAYERRVAVCLQLADNELIRYLVIGVRGSFFTRRDGVSAQTIIAKK